MNYLAHIYLSGDDDQLKIGNFIADSVKGKNFLKFSPAIQKGIILHRAIDVYTDTHPVVRRSAQRLFPRYGHYSRVIVDILYDHYLAANWNTYSTIPLENYTADFYQLLDANYESLPLRVKNFLPSMVRDNWMLNYATIEGIGKILYQMNQRTQNRSRMDLAVHELVEYYDDFFSEFTVFFKELMEFSKRKRKNL